MQEIFQKYKVRHMDYVAATLDILLTKGVREEIRQSDTQKTEMYNLKFMQSFDFTQAIFKYIFVPKLLDFVHLLRKGDQLLSQ